DYALRLHLSTETVRMRIKRGTLAGQKRDGRWYVVAPVQATEQAEQPPEQPTEPRLNGDQTTAQTLAAAVSALTAQLVEKDGQLGEKDPQIATLHQQLADRSREVAELHVMLQTAQRLIPATIAEHAPETRSEASGATNRAEPPSGAADALGAAHGHV